MKHNVAVSVIASIASLIAISGVASAQSTSGHTGLGNPTNAVTSSSATTNYLISRTQYAVGYDSTLCVPRWVCWHLSKRDLGSAARSTTFTSDTSLPSGWYRVTTSNYTNSGYDRGHNCPSADRTLSDTNNAATFILTNIFPQAPDNNQGPWADLEDYCRGLVTAGNELYIISTWDGATGTKVASKIAVPGYTDKIIVVLPDNGQDNDPAADLARITTSTRVITISMDNVQGIRNDDWRSYRCSVNDLEGWINGTYSGDPTFSFLSAVSSTVRSTLKSKVDTL